MKSWPNAEQAGGLNFPALPLGAKRERVARRKGFPVFGDS